MVTVGSSVRKGIHSGSSIEHSNLYATPTIVVFNWSGTSNALALGPNESQALAQGAQLERDALRDGAGWR